MTGLIWFRNDLRTLDHPALCAATENHKQCRALYLLCPAQLDEHIIAPIRRQFLRRALDELSEQLAAIGISLDIINAEHFDKVPEVLADYCEANDIEQVYAHREWLVDEMRRDEACVNQHIPLSLFDDSLIKPTAVSKDDGQPYRVFTPFSRRCRELLATAFPRCHARPATKTKTKLSPGSCPVFGEEQDSTHWQVEEAKVLTQLRQFCQQRAERYKEDRDFPAIDGTSTLSPALSLGLISARQCLARLQLEAGDQIWNAQSGAGCWFNELLWREFYRYIAFHYPRVVMGKAFQEQTERLAWRNNDGEFEAWCQGRTGFPIVDAAMRQLNETGWMHNRLRMITASFLCKDLQVDWRWGERYFLSKLVDADFASNNGGWQWAASTGTDAAPYFRIFNPASQSKRYDPEAVFIRRYLPELGDCISKRIHDAPTASGYPEPIVDHSIARQITLDMFQQIKAENSPLT